MATSKAGLFVYGTLHPDRAPREIAHIVRDMKPIGQGYLRGRLFDFGEYPGLVPAPKAGKVEGTIFSLPENPGALQELDAYEEFQPDLPAESLFVREKRMVTLANGKRQKHWVYRYNQSTEGAKAAA